MRTYTEPQTVALVEDQRERFAVFVQLLTKRMTAERIASAMEEWELILEQRGWLDAFPVPPTRESAESAS